MLYIYDLVDHRNVYENRTIAAEWGYSQEEVDRGGEGFFSSIIHDDDRDRLTWRAKERCATLKDGEFSEIEYRVRRGDGAWRWVHSRDVVFSRDPDGSPRQILGTLQDVTEQKNAEIALMENQRRLDLVSLAVESASDAVIIWNGHGSIEYLNPASSALFGFTAAELNETGLWKRDIDPDARKEMRIALQKGNRWTGDLAIRAKHGGLVPVFLRVTALKGPSSRNIGAIGVATDMTERRRMEEQARDHQTKLAHALRMSSLGEMAASIAHELNQPLTAIASYANGTARRLRSGAVDVDQLLRVVDHISNEAMRSGEIIRRVKQLLDRGEPRRAPVDICLVIHRVCRVVEPRASTDGVKLRIEIPEEVPKLSADEIQLEQAFLNLVGNGLDAMRDREVETASLTIRASFNDEVVTIEVHDRGPGLGDDPSHVFEPFFTTKREHFGLGLSLSRSIAEAHGGRLWATNNNEGGATFHLVLPLAAQSPVPLRPAENLQATNLVPK